MVYLASQLITDSYSLSNVVGVGFQAVSGAQTTQGLTLLNGLLSRMAAEISFIPYFEYDQSITSIQNQEFYFIPNCVYIESLTYNVDTTLRLEMNAQNRRAYFGSSRVDNISALPACWNFLRSEGGGKLYLYPLPAGDYPLNIMGKFALTNVALSTDMSATYDEFYLEYLRFGLAKYICQFNGMSFPDDMEKTLKEMKYSLLNVSSPDMTCKRESFFNNNGGINITSINYYRGYWPTS